MFPAMSAVLESSTDGIVVLRAVRDLEATIVDFELVLVSATAERILKQTAKKLVGTRMSVAIGAGDPERFARFVNAAETGTAWTSRVQLPGLDHRWFDVSATGFSQEGLVAIFRDVTADCERDATMDGLLLRQEALEREVLRDPLTGLGNRVLVATRLEHALSRLDRHATSVAVMFIDLDGLKVINDTHGHAAGDDVLIEIGRRLLSVTRAYDTVARIGGDEFVVVCEDLESTYDIDQIARRFVGLCSTPVAVECRQLTVTASVGVAVAGAGYTDATALLAEADTAMYRAKCGGGGRVEYFEVALQQEMLTRHDVQSGLRQAIEQDELEFEFDHIVTADGERVAFRGHVGWSHPAHGFIDEQTVVAAARKTGTASALTDWVLDQAVAHTALRNACPSGNGTFVMVDVDGAVLTGIGFADRVIDVLDRHRVDPRSLCLAVDGRYLSIHTDPVKGVLDQLAAVGVRVARDGVSPPDGMSHTYLRELPIDLVILDATLTDELSRTDTELLRVVIQTAKGSGQLVMAPSASPAQFDTLTTLGIDLVIDSTGQQTIAAGTILNRHRLHLVKQHDDKLVSFFDRCAGML